MNREQVNEIIEKYNTGKFSEYSEKLARYLSQDPKMYGYLEGKPVKEELNERDQILELAVSIANNKETNTNPVMWEIYWKSDLLDAYRNNKSFLQMLRSKMSGYNVSVVDALKYGYIESVSVMTILFGWYSIIGKIKAGRGKPVDKRIMHPKAAVTIALFTVIFLAAFITFLLHIGYNASRKVLPVLCIGSYLLIFYFHNKK